jgi:hypothetical protein
MKQQLAKRQRCRVYLRDKRADFSGENDGRMDGFRTLTNMVAVRMIALAPRL